MTMHLLDRMQLWEDGEMADGSIEEINLFQELLTFGLLRNLQVGCYGRRAVALIEEGLIE